MVSFNCQLDTTRIPWEDNLNERLFGSGCPVGVSAGVVLTILTDWDKCEQHHSLDSGPRLYKNKEGYLSTQHALD